MAKRLTADTAATKTLVDDGARGTRDAPTTGRSVQLLQRLGQRDRDFRRRRRGVQEFESGVVVIVETCPTHEKNAVGIVIEVNPSTESDVDSLVIALARILLPLGSVFEFDR